MMTHDEVWHTVNAIEKSLKATLPAGERLPSRRVIEKLVIEKIVSADSASKTNESAPVRVEKDMSERVEKREGLFDNLINREGAFEGVERVVKIEKSADVVEFEMTSGGLRRVDPMLTQPGGNPKPTDATREPANRASNFPTRPVPSAADAHGLAHEFLDYVDSEITEPDVTSAGTIPPNFLLSADDGGLKGPSLYSPAQPGRLPTDPGGKPADLKAKVDPFETDEDEGSKSTKSIRLGTGYVFARKRRA